VSDRRPARRRALPLAEGDCHVVLIEPRSTLNTGNVRNERTVDQLEHL
jgi:hypothetical protein